MLLNHFDRSMWTEHHSIIMPDENGHSHVTKGLKKMGMGQFTFDNKMREGSDVLAHSSFRMGVWDDIAWHL